LIDNKAPDCNGRGLCLWLESGDFVPKYVWREYEVVEPTNPARHVA